ncbi:hypothetical protein EDD66_10522 [Mobilisporobacter senegalensis]|uniref:Uncharacterized protein n=1 Tax=Mobilisporobacter senegalensis TaxID=1329262 RepID=A0A3N1XN26_9FIRM|nr:hypothetical protein [Mobilisporobacter senegalensis]ROR28084.1 hypothetical protein EDD66_10522 [Mobilisporobacter senegalensis]
MENFDKEHSAFTEEEILEELSRLEELNSSNCEQNNLYNKRKIYDRRGTNEEKEYSKLKSNYNNIRDWMY